MIRTHTDLEMISSPLSSLGGSAGEGDFTVADDRLKLAPVLQGALLRKLRFLLKAQDLVGYRVLLNMQESHLRGLPASRLHWKSMLSF